MLLQGDERDCSSRFCADGVVALVGRIVLRHLAITFDRCSNGEV